MLLPQSQGPGQERGGDGILRPGMETPGAYALQNLETPSPPTLPEPAELPPPLPITAQWSPPFTSER